MLSIGAPFPSVAPVCPEPARSTLCQIGPFGVSNGSGSDPDVDEGPAEKVFPEGQAEAGSVGLWP
jgi:hypothetical protein